MKQPVKIAYYISHPIQYFSPLFRKMSGQLDLTVYYFSDASVSGGIDKGFGKTVQWDIPLLQGYKSVFLKNWSGRASMDNGFLDAVNPSVFSTLWKDKASIVIVNGWSYSSTWMAIIGAKLMGKKVWLRAESPLNQEMRKSKKLLFFKKILLGKFLFSLFIDKCLYIGTESKKFFTYYGVKDKHLLFTPYAVDNEYFRNALPANKSMTELRQAQGLPTEKKIILFTGKFIAKKRPLDLIRAFSLLKNTNSVLVMVGEGELRNEMEELIRQEKLTNIILTGFVNQGAIPIYYKVADVFVMCSGMGETWGLAVNEAMSFNKPIIVSDTCGCQSDLVKDGVNGFVFREGDVSELALRLEKILGDDLLKEQMGLASGSIIENFTIDTIVQNIKKELQQPG